MQRTVSVVLQPDAAIVATIRIFNECCQSFLDLGFHRRRWSKRALQEDGYYEARQRWPRLQSSLVQGARDCAADMLKREKGKTHPHKGRDSAARFNQRTFKAFLDSGILSLTTIEGRKKVPLRIPAYFQRYLGGKVAALRVRIDRVGRLRADLIVDLPDVPIQSRDPPVVRGMDRGIRNIAVLDDGTFYNSKAVRKVRGRYAYLRRRLQSAGTRSAKRHLRRLVLRERRFQRDVNHTIAKQVAAADLDVLALEDLQLGKAKRRGRRFNRMLGGWAYFQLEAFLQYKLEDRGKRTVKVPPEYTSKMCSRCGNLGSRVLAWFQCHRFGLQLDADLNAARNIAHLGNALVSRPPVNGPIVASEETEHRTSVELSYKPPTLVGGC